MMLNWLKGLIVTRSQDDKATPRKCLFRDARSK